MSGQHSIRILLRILSNSHTTLYTRIILRSSRWMRPRFFSLSSTMTPCSIHCISLVPVASAYASSAVGTSLSLFFTLLLTPQYHILPFPCMQHTLLLLLQHQSFHCPPHQLRWSLTSNLTMTVALRRLPTCPPHPLDQSRLHPSRARHGEWLSDSVVDYYQPILYSMTLFWWCAALGHQHSLMYVVSQVPQFVMSSEDHLGTHLADTGHLSFWCVMAQYMYPLLHMYENLKTL